MKGSAKTLVYAACLGVGSSVLMGTVGFLTAPYREMNEKAERMKHVLHVLEVPFDPKASSRELLKVFAENVTTQQRGQETWYLYRPAGATTNAEGAAAVHFDGQGVWGPIKGFLALSPDMKTIRGVTFYQQEETPGLGSEIESPVFRGRFAGKSVRAENGDAGIRIVAPGKSRARNEVDAISGATMTCRRVEDILNGVIGALPKEPPSHE